MKHSEVEAQAREIKECGKKIDMQCKLLLSAIKKKKEKKDLTDDATKVFGIFRRPNTA